MKEWILISLRPSISNLYLSGLNGMSFRFCELVAIPAKKFCVGENSDDLKIFFFKCQLPKLFLKKSFSKKDISDFWNTPSFFQFPIHVLMREEGLLSCHFPYSTSMEEKNKINSKMNLGKLKKLDFLSTSLSLSFGKRVWSNKILFSLSLLDCKILFRENVKVRDILIDYMILTLRNTQKLIDI